MSVFKRLWSNTEKGSLEQKVVQVEEIGEFQPYNPFTELLFLEQHHDIVRLLIKIDSKRCVSAADDNLAVVWDIQFGYKLVTLSGHSRPITDMLLLSQNKNTQKLATGSFDKQIRIWDLDTGDCLSVLNEHQSAVKCLSTFGVSGEFCSGGKTLCLWSKSGKLLSSCAQDTEENDINMIVELKNDRMIVASDRHLAVYVVNHLQEVVLMKRLVPHRETIKCLVNIKDDVFASASLDGTISVWHTDSLASNMCFNFVNDPEGPEKTFPCSVQCMIPLSNRYIMAAVGAGFALYDTETGATVLHKQNAHHSKINHLCFTCDGLYLATAAVDGSIRLWSNLDVIKDSLHGEHGCALKYMKSEFGLLSMWYKMDENKVSLAGECLAHDGPVQVLLDCDGESLVSCGVDGQVIVWKNDNIQMMKRSHVLQTLKICDGIV